MMQSGNVTLCVGKSKSNVSLRIEMYPGKVMHFGKVMHIIGG